MQLKAKRESRWVAISYQRTYPEKTVSSHLIKNNAKRTKGENGDERRKKPVGNCMKAGTRLKARASPLTHDVTAEG